MGTLYAEIFYKPLLNTLVFFYQTIAFRDLGFAIIFLTILIRLILFPIFQKSARHQMVMQRLQPKIKKIQEEHRHSRQKQGEAMMTLYKEHQVNPFSGFFLLLVQLPVLIALYQIFLRSLSPELITGLYSFVNAPEHLSASFLGLINLDQKNILIASLATLAQYFQGRLSMLKRKEESGKEPTMAERVGKQMVFVGPIVTFSILMNLPAAVGLYWSISALFSVFQQIIVNRKLDHGELGNIHKKTA